jgi:GAF domain-containing protein/HAMP domain-containing protein
MIPEPRTGGFFQSVRSRLSLAVTLVAVFPILLASLAVIVAANSAVMSGLGTTLNDRISNGSQIAVKTLSGQMDMLLTLSTNRALVNSLNDANALYAGDVAVMAQMAQNDADWRANRSSSNPLVAGVLNHGISQNLLYFQQAFPAHREVFITDRYGANIASTGVTTDYYQGDEAWWQSAWNQGAGAAYIADEVEFDDSAGILSLVMAVPIRDHQNQDAVVGVLRTTYDVQALATSIADLSFLETGRILLVDRNGYELLAGEQANQTLFISPTLLDTELVNFIEDPSGARVAAKTLPLTTNGLQPEIDRLGWQVAAAESEEEVFRSANRAVGFVLAAGLVVMVVAMVLGLAIARWLTRPLPALANAARRLRDGDWKSRVEISNRDEFGELALALNGMAEQLESVVGSMEQRIAARTRDLQTVASVNQQISTILKVDRLLQDVVDLTKERFRLYHAHIYVMDEKGEKLVLTSGAGNVGRKMVSEGRQIAPDNPQSIVARAATTRKPVTVQDVRQSPTFLPHPLLPDTRSELAVPLVARGQLLGVLDVQSDVANYFDTDVIGVVELLAGQVASALSNASLYEIADRTSRHERALGSIDRRIQAAADVDEILQVAVRELGKALRVPHTAVQLRMGEPASESN